MRNFIILFCLALPFSASAIVMGAAISGLVGILPSLRWSHPRHTLTISMLGKTIAARLPIILRRQSSISKTPTLI